MLNSFRIRLTMFSVLLSGTVLAVFASSAWILIYRSKLESLQQEMSDRGFQILSRHQREAISIVRNPDRSDQFFISISDKEPFALFARDAEGNQLFMSKNWPGDIPPADVVEPDHFVIDQSDRPPPHMDREYRPPFDDEFGDRRPPPHEMFPPPIQAGRPDYVTFNGAEGQWIVGIMKNRELTIALAVNEEELNAAMSGITRSMLIALPVGLLLIGIGGWFLAGMATRPIRRLAEAAEKITAHGLDTRISSVGEAEEFKRLIDIFNQMLERLDRSFQQALRFSSDAAHELKTPLTVLQQQLEQALQRAENESEEQQTYASLVEEVQRLKSITQKLLLLSQTDAGQLKLNADSFDLSSAVENLAEDIGALAPVLRVDSSIESGVTVEGDGDLLNQALQNLVDNAIKYNVDNGRIELVLKRTKEGVAFQISNTGPMVSEGDRKKIFKRFYRADKSRSKETQGHGLGLSLAREIVRAHGGDLILQQSDDQCTIFKLTLPSVS